LGFGNNEKKEKNKSKFIVYGFRFMVSGLWFQVYGFRFMVSGLWFQVYGLTTNYKYKTKKNMNPEWKVSFEVKNL